MHNLSTPREKVKLEEIACHATVPYNVYDFHGKLLCKQGEPINSKLIRLLCINRLYRHSTPEEIATKTEKISAISQESTNKIVTLTTQILSIVEKKGVPPIQVVQTTRDFILDETRKVLPKVNNLGELRIYYDEYYSCHIINVSILATALAIRLGSNSEILQNIALGGLMHDIGMTRIPKEIVNKPDKLTTSEYELIKMHPKLGYKIIKDECLMPDPVAMIALEHHERNNGSGYPRAIDGSEINYLAQIVAMADVYDAAVSNKVYAKGKASESVARELLKVSKSFNPAILNSLIYMIGYKD